MEKSRIYKYIFNAHTQNKDPKFCAFTCGGS